MNNIASYFGLAKKTGLIGFEIELEGTGFPELDQNITGWTTHTDGSLRGDNREYVFRKPESVSSAKVCIGHLFQILEKNQTKVKPTARAGVHVHLNMQDSDAYGVIKFLCIYYLLENVLTSFCGKERIGNLHCLRATDAEALFDDLTRVCDSPERGLYDQLHWMVRQNARYAALNITAIARYGSLEFRAMRSTLDKQVLFDWIDMIVALKEYVNKINHPEETLEQMSIRGPIGLLIEIFGHNLAQKLVNACPDYDQQMWDVVTYLHNAVNLLPKPKKKEDKIEKNPQHTYYVNPDEDALARRLTRDAARIEEIRARQAPQPREERWIVDDEF